MYIVQFLFEFIKADFKKKTHIQGSPREHLNKLNNRQGQIFEFNLLTPDALIRQCIFLGW